jgi:hypothetical protein
MKQSTKEVEFSDEFWTEAVQWVEDQLKRFDEPDTMLADTTFDALDRMIEIAITIIRKADAGVPALLQEDVVDFRLQRWCRDVKSWLEWMEDPDEDFAARVRAAVRVLEWFWRDRRGHQTA